MQRFLTVALTLGVIAGSASADLIPDRTTLEGMLGGGGTLEDFETLKIDVGGQRADSGGLLNSTTLFDGDGPGLVQPGADYMAPTMWWNGDQYFALNTQTLGDSSGWRGNQITIAYTTSVTAMGIDMQGYDGFSMVGTVSVYDTSNNLLGSTNVDGGFFGWEDAGGIGSVVVSADTGYIMIDNHLYGEDAGGDVELYLDGSRISNPEGCAEFCCLFNGDSLQNYQEDGLTVNVNDIHFRFTPCNFTDEHYYPNGGVAERISITRTDGNDFGHVEFEVSHGFAGCDVILWMTPYLDGVPQGQFTADVTAGTLIGFEGVFDEVLVGSYADPATRDQMNEANLNAVVLDNVCFDSGASDDCLTMVVSTLIANAPADWVVCGATPDVEVAVVYGFNPGNTSVNGFAGYCADFGIDGVNQNKVVCRKKADGSGCITCRVGSLPARPGTRILTQAAMKGTCPDPCMSNLDDQIVQ